MATPNWNDDGIDILANSKKRYFSPNINFDTMTVYAGALTNFPAIRERDTDLPIMKPVSLSDGRMTYKKPADNSMIKLLERISRGIDTIINADDDDPNPSHSNGGSNMDKKVKVFLESISKEQRAELATVLIEGVIDDGEIADMVSGEVKTSLEGVGAMVKSKVDAGVAMEMHKREAVAMSATIVGGDAEVQRGIPVETDVMEKFLLSLNTDQYKTAVDILNSVRKDGLVEFDEKGKDDPEATGKKELSAPMKVVLRNSIAAGATVKGFFEVNAEDLGEMSDYDLVEFEPKPKSE